MKFRIIVVLLMDSVRGKDKKPGEFRVTQNWIGSPGCAIEEATFVPPSPLQLIDHLEGWQAYMAVTDFGWEWSNRAAFNSFVFIH